MADILNGGPASLVTDDAIDEKWLLMKKQAGDIVNQRKRLSVDLKQMIAGLKVEEIRAKIDFRSRLLNRLHLAHGPASTTPQFSRWMGRLNRNIFKEQKQRSQDAAAEKVGIDAFMYFYICNNPESIPPNGGETKTTIDAYLNKPENKDEILARVVDVASFIEPPPSGPKPVVVAGGQIAGGLTIEQVEEQMNKAIEEDDVVKMYDLYIEYFDKETPNLLFYQVYSILSKKSIYVPLYRCDVPSLEEWIAPIHEKRLGYTGDLHDFDCVYADHFCVQIFGKNVNELLHDLSKGNLTVPRGVFPNICNNPFDPYSLICILEVCRFFCLFLPFAGRLHFYFAGVLSFMSQTYDRNMVQIQTDEILSYLNHPDFFQCFHAAARMYERVHSESVEVPAEVPAEVPVEVPAEVSAEVPVEGSVEGPAGPPVPPDPNSVAVPLYQKKEGDYGGTRRYRRYKQKTKRHTLNKRFKKHRTRRLHGLHVRN